ncbi:hypothetical protein F4813DRAFT_387688 [Daldinia decipiens]|uniref:uncharacterized protein n=1 Tax=Daldinia decipiens TaxID=326647 RepID=UPI0020C4FA54|nr:uncharacterized protein F4813DRAFT_387688 [Daldinia decipiens]KAI1659581.1 hypothetical protein F4813DRAFT_387688 [Daldinia decipiens]
MASTSLDLTLPEAAPGLTTYGKYSWGDAFFYLYNLVPGVNLAEVAAGLQEVWYKEENVTPIIKIARPEADFAGKTLSDVVAAHVAADKGIKLDKVKSRGSKRRHRESMGNISVYPTAFVVVTKKDWKKDGGLLWVYVMDGKKGKGGKLDKFFFRFEDAYLLLAGVLFVNCTLNEAKREYDIEARHDDDDDDDDDEEEETTDEEDDD